MKHTLLALFAVSILTSCQTPAGSQPQLPAIPQPVINEAVKIGTAASIGYLQAGKAGAVAAASGQAITDLQAFQASAKTAAKNPVSVQP